MSAAAGAESALSDITDINDPISRSQAVEAAGADGRYAPWLARTEHTRAVCSSVSKPGNVSMGSKCAPFSVAQLAALGVKRISVGSALSRAAPGALIRAANEIKSQGTFGFANDALPFADAHDLGSDRAAHDDGSRPRPPVPFTFRLPSAVEPTARPQPCHLGPTAG